MRSFVDGRNEHYNLLHFRPHQPRFRFPFYILELFCPEWRLDWWIDRGRIFGKTRRTRCNCSCFGKASKIYHLEKFKFKPKCLCSLIAELETNQQFGLEWKWDRCWICHDVTNWSNFFFLQRIKRLDTWRLLKRRYPRSSSPRFKLINIRKNYRPSYLCFWR